MAQRAAHRTAECHRQISSCQPSIFDILAQESLMSTLRPAAKHLSKFLAWSYPNLFSGFARRFDEWYTVADLLLQNYYLKNYSALFSENFYDMKRVHTSSGENLTASTRWRSLIVAALIPYVRLKLDELHDRIKRESERKQATSSNEWSRLKKAFLAVYPIICAGLEFWTLILQAGYILSKTSVHSPWLLFAGVRLERMTPADYANMDASAADVLPSRAGIWFRTVHLIKRWMAALFRLFAKLLGVGLLLIQFLDYWKTSEKSARTQLTSLPVPPAPHPVLTEQSVVKMDPRLCPICRKPRQNDTVISVSGFVYCYVCIAKYLQEHRCCPVTKLPAGTEHLIRLFVAHSRTG